MWRGVRPTSSRPPAAQGPDPCAKAPVARAPAHPPPRPPLGPVQAAVAGRRQCVALYPLPSIPNVVLCCVGDAHAVRATRPAVQRRSAPPFECLAPRPPNRSSQSPGPRPIGRRRRGQWASQWARAMKGR